MTLESIFAEAYAWADQNALVLGAVAVGVPVAGTFAAWVGRGGRTDRDGKFFANIVVAFAILLFLVEVIGIAIAQCGFDHGIMGGNVVLLLAPVVGLALALLGVRLVFPLNQLASARVARDVGLFVVAVLGLLWLFSQFRGWGIVFFGGLAQLAVIAVVVFYFMRRLYRRAFKARKAG